MEIPPKIRIPLCVDQGSVFNFYIEFSDLKRESKNRYFVVLNQNPKTDTALIMITSTKQTDKRREFVKRCGISEDTIVEVKAKEYSVFTMDSAFDCNEIFEVAMKDLIRKVEEDGSMDYPKIPSNILIKLINGVKKSPRVSQAIKDLI